MAGTKSKSCGFVSEQSDLDCIETNLWLGNLSAASNAELLEEKNVKYILTINSYPLPKEIVNLSYINVKYIEAFDTARDDLLSYFEETYEFIDCAIKKGVILVHCYHGVSRSPTIVTAYLMRKNSLTMNTALNYIKSKRKCIEPNFGFLAQLKLYEIMYWTVDKSNPKYKMFRLKITASHIKKENAVPSSCVDVIKADPLEATITDHTVYRCKKCRRIIAQHSNIIPHVEMEAYNWSESLDKSEKCQQIYFVEPLAWMENVAISLGGKLLCPNIMCKNKLGSFSWINGCNCPCGTHMCPGFYLIPSKVDKQTAVSMSTSKNRCYVK